MTALRHLLSILLLPVAVTVAVPLWIARVHGVPLALDATAGAFVLRLAGIVVAATGLVLVASSIAWFARAGRGTLAPWDPPRLLVVGGPYRFVRHPMISGVLLILAGEAIALRSPMHAIWALAVLAINLLYIPLVEEPALRRRFGGLYDLYRRHVPAIVPRATPWRPEAAGPAAVRVVDYDARHREAFRALNLEWIEALFAVEAADRAVLDHPERAILEPGGHILIAERDGVAVGCCALLRESADVYELAKMAVAPAARGQGIGLLLGRAAIERARAAGARRVELQTNSSLGAALHVYRKLGFVDEPVADTPYARADVQMAIDLDSPG